jgi:hypothetical protein
MWKIFDVKWWPRVLTIVTVLLITAFGGIFLGPVKKPATAALEQLHASDSTNSPIMKATAQERSLTSSTTAQNPADEDKVAAILGDQNLAPSDVVKCLVEELPRFDTSKQKEAAQHIANLSDEKTATIWVQKLIYDQLPPPAAEILFINLLTRSEELSLPTLAAIADQPNHPRQAESAQILEPLLGTPKPDSCWKELLRIKPINDISILKPTPYEE